MKMIYRLILKSVEDVMQTLQIALFQIIGVSEIKFKII